MAEPRHTALFHFTNCDLTQCVKPISQETVLHLNDLEIDERSTSYIGPKAPIKWDRAFGYFATWFLLIACAVAAVDGLIWLTRWAI